MMKNLLRNKSVLLVKVLWQRHGLEEATSEMKENMKSQYPNLFFGRFSRTKIPLGLESCNILFFSGDGIVVLRL
ncbi:DNA/RNA polymerases superfamily protein [Gossypium australe]|uniref:DNA/RNA polymerases superfamily protein n=1 Tax=Gossypium australe TaxID=47621 RepID=A0A5B6W7F8_9ROSI|nr:DNA/RNA polymerases superfamily protein [Gossypium australe]